MIALSEPQIGTTEWNYVKECLETNWVSSSGRFVDKFESLVSEYVGTKYAVATNSGTSAIHLALQISGVKPNDEVLVSTLTFIAPANAIRYIGAWPVFIDAEKTYWQMDPDKLQEFIDNNCHWVNDGLYNKTTNRKIAAILPVHILGHPCDMDRIWNIASKYNLTIIEDASESIGAQYKSTMVGNIGHVTCFSFNGNKTITCGGGGIITTNNQEWAINAKYLSTQAKDDEIEYIHNQIGYNYRLTNMQAALGCAQIEQIDCFLRAKKRIADRYTSAFAEMEGITQMQQASWAKHSYWLYTILVDDLLFGTNSRELLSLLHESDIQTRPLWQPMHKSKAHTDSGSYECPIAEQLNNSGLSLPSSVGLDETSQNIVINTIKSIGPNKT